MAEYFIICLYNYIQEGRKMEELREISKKLNETVEDLKADRDIEKTVDELHEIRDKLKKIVKESTR